MPISLATLQSGCLTYLPSIPILLSLMCSSFVGPCFGQYRQSMMMGGQGYFACVFFSTLFPMKTCETHQCTLIPVYHLCRVEQSHDRLLQCWHLKMTHKRCCITASGG